jgi:hypothetical protein
LRFNNRLTVAARRLWRRVGWQPDM